MDVILFDNCAHSSLRTFCIMTDSAVLAAVPLCRDTMSTTFKFSVLQLILGCYSPYFKNSSEYFPAAHIQAPF